MNAIERIKMVKAMEFIVRHLNDEYQMEEWLLSGVSDGEIESGDLSVKATDPEVLDFYLEDRHLSELMTTFLLIMRTAPKYGSLYCDGIVNKKP